MPPIPYKKTKTTSSGWDASKQVANLETPLTKATADAVYAWVDPNGDPTVKSSYKFPHHMVTNHVPGAASTSACSAGIAAINGARTPTTIPTADRKGVYAHLRQHLIDHGVEPEDIPTLRSPGASMTTTTTKTRKSTKPCPACGGSGKLTGGESPSENLPCPECEGDGEVPAVPMSTNSAAALRAGYRNIVERRQTPEYMPVEMRSVDNGTGGQALLFTGYASVTERGYEMVDKFGEYTETIDRSAFDRTLADGCDTNMTVNHEGLSLARTKAGTLKLSADDTGLHAEARLNPDRADVQLLRSAVEDGSLDEMSMAFRVHKQEWSPDFDQRRIQEISLAQGDISVVNYGASPHTAGTVSLRRKDDSDFTVRRSSGRPIDVATMLADARAFETDTYLRLQRMKLEWARRGR